MNDENDKLKTWSISALVAEFYDEVEALAEEMEEWRSNIEEKFSSTDKYQRVDECASTLQGIVDSKDTDAFDEVDDDDTTTPFDPPKLKKKASRADRMGKATACGREAASRLEGYFDGEVLMNRDPDALRELADKMETLKEAVDRLDSDLDEAEGVEFPGMFG